MKIIGIEDDKKPRKLNKKKVVIVGIVAAVILVFLILFIIYSASQSFRDIVDKYILMKNVIEDSTNFISLEENDTNNVYAYDKYICVLNKNTLRNYNSYGKEEGEITIEIRNPITATNGRYLLIAEKEKNKIYLISGNEIVWQKDLEGNIDKMTVNKNGYVAVVLSGTTHKSVIQLFDNSGSELFKTYLSSTIVMDVDISLDNQYLAFVEINTNGTTAKSTIKVVSIQKAKAGEEDWIAYTYEEPEGNLIINIKYQDGNRLVCMSDNAVCTIKKDSNQEIFKLENEDAKLSFADIELYSDAYRILEKSSLLNTKTSVEIANTGNKNISLYTFDGVTKECFSYDDTIAINIGSEVHFISTNGWLIKKYISSQEVKKVVMCNNFAGIVYRNKIEIVNI